MRSTSRAKRSPGKAATVGIEPSPPRQDEIPEQEATGRVPVSHQVPDDVEWEESLIGIEPNSGVAEPPTIC